MISDTKLQAIIGWSPKKPKRHEKQIEILNCFNKGVSEIAVSAGVRGGKTAIAAYFVLKTFLQGLDDIKKGKRDSIKIWIVAPTYELTQKVFEYVIKWFLKFDPSISKMISMRPFPQIKIAEGVWIQCKSATEPYSLLGEELDLVVLDECSRMSQEIWERYIFARLSSRMGRAMFISTPFGQNWFYKKCMELKPKNCEFEFRSIDNPYFPLEKWEQAKKTLPEQVFNQEYRASFLPDAAAVFRGVDGIIKDDCLKDVIKDHRYAMGVDLGKHEDFTVLTVIDKYNNNVVYWDRFKNIEYPFQKKRIKATAQRYNNARVVIDSTGVGEPIWEDLRRDGIFVDDYKFTNKSKKELVEKLSIMIEQKLVFIPVLQILIDEIHSFGYHLTDSGNVTYSAPQGLHDDAVISLALAVWGLRGKPNPTSALKQLLGETHKKRNFQYD